MSERRGGACRFPSTYILFGTELGMDLVKFIRNCIITIVLETNLIFFLNALNIMIISIIIHNFDCKYMNAQNAHVHRCLCVCVGVHACTCLCVHVCVRACALRIVSMDRMFHFTNTLIIIIITCQPCASILLQTTALTKTRKVDNVHFS